MNEVKTKVEDCVRQIREKTDFIPRVALILGSGLGGLAEEIEIKTAIPYQDIEGFPTSTVIGHEGRFVFGYMGETPVVIMQGRVHYYEGYTISDVVLPTRVMRLLGAEILFLTNAAGGISSHVEAGDLLLLTDHISTFMPSPLIGSNVEEWGTRFPSMDTVYDLELRELLKEVSADIKTLKEGIYLQTSGPSYETPAEVRMFRSLGADAVGMSTAVEAMVARHMGMKVCGISCITNMAGGTADKPLSHKEVQEIANQLVPKFKKIVRLAIEKM